LITVEIRRSSIRLKPSKRLSLEGLRLAKMVAPYLGGPYHAYYSSRARRARDTLKGLGFPTYREVEEFDPLPAAFDRFERELLLRQRQTGCNFLQGYLGIPEAREELRIIGRRLVEAVHKIVRKLPPEGRALIVSHSGVIEALGLIVREEDDPSYVSEALRHLEGLAFEFVGGEIRQMRVLRIPGDVITGFSSIQKNDNVLAGE